MNLKIKVAIVEDKKLFRQGLVTLLEEFDKFEIVNESSNGLEIIEWLKNNMADIIVMDMQMPEMDGYAATDRIREWERAEHKSPIPIIALTAHALSEDRQKSLKAGCNDHIAKPFKKDTLLGVINKYSL